MMASKPGTEEGGLAEGEETPQKQRWKRNLHLAFTNFLGV
jgi:hypothetical protein